MKFDKELIEYFNIDLFKNYNYLLNPDMEKRDVLVIAEIERIINENENMTDELYEFLQHIEKLVSKSKHMIFWN